jgi:tetratricopeptide (TPR) repeat protein
MNHRVLLFLSVFLFFSLAAAADIIVLKSGGKIYSAEWWYEGNELKYIGYGGVYGISVNEIADVISSEPLREEIEVPSAAEVSPPHDQAPSPDFEIKKLEALAEKLAKMSREKPAEEKELELQSSKVYTKVGNILFDNRNYEKAISYYQKAIEQCPSFLAPKINLSSTYMATGNINEALPYALETISEYPGEPALHQVLGDIYYLMDRMDAAIYEWEEAIRLKPNKKIAKKIAKARKERELSRDFHVENAAHFTLKFDGEKHPAIGNKIVSYLEESFDDLLYRFNHYPPMATTVILYPDKAFYDITEVPKWVGGLYDGKIRIPVKGMTHLTKKSKNVLRHELAHVFIFSKTNGNCPIWFHEGIAQIIEGKSSPSFKRIKEKIAIVDASWLEKNIDYPVSLSLTAFLEERFSYYSVNMILDELGKGSNMNEAIKTSIDLNLSELIQEWKLSFSLYRN